MSYMTKKAILNRLSEHYSKAEECGEIFGIFLQGSQNYTTELNDPHSDLDSTVVVIPDFKSLCLLQKPLSKELHMDNDEHVNVKDIREFVRLLYKSNINTLELLYTEYYVINPKYQELYEELVDMRDEIAGYDVKRLFASTKGMAYRNYKMFQEGIDGEEYNGKAVAHVVRLRMFMENILNDNGFGLALTAMDPVDIINIKRSEVYDVSDATEIADQNIKQLLQMYDHYTEKERLIQEDVKENLDNYLVKLLKERFKDQIVNE